MCVSVFILVQLNCSPYLSRFFVARFSPCYIGGMVDINDILV